MKSQKLRVIIPLLILVVAGVGFVWHTGFGNLSAFGWKDIALLCPVGALGTMLASKTFIPQALISLVLAIIAIVLLGRAFCGWVCPVPVVEKLRGAFAKQKPEVTKELKAVDEALSEEEKKLLHSACGKHNCKAENNPSNSRYLVLGGGLLSAAIFGFPVFCLICPIGLTFALIFVLIALFGFGDVTWSVVVIPVVLILEVVVFRKWCSHICPLSAFMSLISKANKTFRPTVNEKACVESASGSCGRCAQVCPVGINPRHPEEGASMDECTKCRACVEVCPGKALSMPFLKKPATPCESLKSTEEKAPATEE